MPFIQTMFLTLGNMIHPIQWRHSESNSGNKRSYSGMMGDPGHTKEQSSGG
jgi:hypothetical protein